MSSIYTHSQLLMLELLAYLSLMIHATHGKSLKTNTASQAISLLCLDYICSSLANRERCVVFFPWIGLLTIGRCVCSLFIVVGCVFFSLYDTWIILCFQLWSTSATARFKVPSTVVLLLAKYCSFCLVCIYLRRVCVYECEVVALLCVRRR